jgi:hypothetical protein
MDRLHDAPNVKLDRTAHELEAASIHQELAAGTGTAGCRPGRIQC